MNRENKRKQHEKGYYKTHPCDESFTCRNCGHPVVPAGAGSDHRNHCPNCLCSVHLDIEPGDRAVGLRRTDGAGGGVGSEKRRMGDHPPLPPVRRVQLQPGRGGR